MRNFARALLIAGLASASTMASAATYTLAGQTPSASGDGFSYSTNTFQIQQYNGSSPLLGVSFTLSGSFGASSYIVNPVEPWTGSVLSTASLNYSADSSNTLLSSLFQAQGWTGDVGSFAGVSLLSNSNTDSHTGSSSSVATAHSVTDHAVDQSFSVTRPTATDPALADFLAAFQGTGSLDLTLQEMMFVAINDSGLFGAYDRTDVTDLSNVTLTVTYVAAVPEPASLLLLGLGLFAAIGASRRVSRYV